jgi:hypothetical protein
MDSHGIQLLAKNCENPSLLRVYCMTEYLSIGIRVQYRTNINLITVRDVGLSWILIRIGTENFDWLRIRTKNVCGSKHWS